MNLKKNSLHFHKISHKNFLIFRDVTKVLDKIPDFQGFSREYTPWWRMREYRRNLLRFYFQKTRKIYIISRDICAIKSCMVPRKR